MMALKAGLQLTRPANLLTAVADILAGMAIAGLGMKIGPAFWLFISTLGLYGGGVVLNDVFDAHIDAVERPERPIPSGRISIRSAALLGVALLAAGVVAAAVFSVKSGMIALAIALATVLYNRLAKHSRFFGPLIMGLCRGGNLLLGISAVGASLAVWWPVAFVPVVYIAAITLISQDEVHGGKRVYLYLAALFYLAVHFTQGIIALDQGHFLITSVLIVIHASLIGKPLLKAIKLPVGPLIGKAVKAGVLSLIVMNAAWCMAFGNWELSILALVLLPLSLELAKIFAVT